MGDGIKFLVGALSGALVVLLLLTGTFSGRMMGWFAVLLVLMALFILYENWHVIL